jgi:hypothetical protein
MGNQNENQNCIENKKSKHAFVSKNFLFENGAVYEIMWENVAHTDRQTGDR